MSTLTTLNIDDKLLSTTEKPLQFITLNVGGKLFSTTKETLQNLKEEGHLLSKLFSNDPNNDKISDLNNDKINILNNEKPNILNSDKANDLNNEKTSDLNNEKTNVLKDKNKFQYDTDLAGNIFIDRSYELFNYILDYLRTCGDTTDIGLQFLTPKEHHMLIIECRFYGLEHMRKCLRDLDFGDENNKGDFIYKEKVIYEESRDDDIKIKGYEIKRAIELLNNSRKDLLKSRGIKKIDNTLKLKEYYQPKECKKDVFKITYKNTIDTVKDHQDVIRRLVSSYPIDSDKTYNRIEFTLDMKDYCIKNKKEDNITNVIAMGIERVDLDEKSLYSDDRIPLCFKRVKNHSDFVSNFLQKTRFNGVSYVTNKPITDTTKLNTMNCFPILYTHKWIYDYASFLFKKTSKKVSITLNHQEKTLTYENENTKTNVLTLPSLDMTTGVYRFVFYLRGVVSISIIKDNK